MRDEWWLRAAISDDRLVAELLLRLKESDDVATAAAGAAVIKTSSSTMMVLPLTWGVRQPRSSVEKSKRDSTPRRSPTTPLSWGCCVGGASGGGTASPSDGGEDSSSLHNNNSHHGGGGGGSGSQPSDLRCRSKISASTETPATTSKRPRRKKTFAELKEEESSLLKERTYLKKELATLRVTLKEQRSINENLKRIKLDLHVESGVKTEANSMELRNRNNNGASEGASSNTSRQVKTEGCSGPSDPCPAQRVATSSEEPLFVLPDLNMMPDDECGIVGMS